MRDTQDAHDDPLDRAIAALRDTAIPQGPSPALLDRTLGTIHKRDFSGTTLVYRRRVAAAVALVLCLLAVWVVRSRYASHPIVRDSHPAPVPHTPEIPLAIRPEHSGQHVTPLAQESGPQRTIIASTIAVTGHIYYQGPTAVRAPIDVRNCPQCMEVSQGDLYDDSLIVSPDSTLQNVVVSISAGLPTDEIFSPPSEPVVLDQKGCMFRPHVVASMVGQNVIVRNSDPLLHSVHSMDAEDTPAFNFAQPTIGQRSVEPLRVIETFRVKCDLHPWMNAWVRVFNHPYFAVTPSDGEFTIKNLPPGNYRIKAWHERLGVQEKQIVVRRGAPAIIDFVFTVPNAVQKAK